MENFTWAKWSKGGSGNERLARAYEVALIFGKCPTKELKDSDSCPLDFALIIMMRKKKDLNGVITPITNLFLSSNL